MKFIDKDLIIEENLVQNIKTELNLMKTIKHPYIVQLYEILSSAQKIIFVMEYVEGGDLFDEIKRGENERLGEEKSRYYFQQIITALEYCHNKNIIHRDLKPENILFDQKENRIKISDFGLATILKEKDEKLSDFCGTTNYIAPEIIKETGKIFSSGGYSGQPADIWSSGVILYNMVSGENPFYHFDKAISINNILNANIEYPSYFSSGLVDLLKNIFVTQPKLRYNIESIKKHPWFSQNYNSKTIYINDLSLQQNLLNENEAYSSLDGFKISQDDIPYANCFAITSILTGKWVSSMFKDGKTSNTKKMFESKEHYEWYTNQDWDTLEKKLNIFYGTFKYILFKQRQKGIFNIDIKKGAYGNDNVNFDMMIYKISKNSKYILCFEYKDGNKVEFSKIMKKIDDSEGDILFHF